MFQELVLSILPLLQKHVRPGQDDLLHHSIYRFNTWLKKTMKKKKEKKKRKEKKREESLETKK